MRPYAPGLTPPARWHASRPAQSRSKAAAGQRYLRRAAGAPAGLEALERHRPRFAGLGADAGHPAAFVMHDDVGAVGGTAPA